MMNDITVRSQLLNMYLQYNIPTYVHNFQNINDYRINLNHNRLICLCRINYIILFYKKNLSIILYISCIS